MSYLAKGAGSQDLILNTTGRGRMYYRIGMTYAPASLTLDPADHDYLAIGPLMLMLLDDLAADHDAT